MTDVTQTERDIEALVRQAQALLVEATALAGNAADLDEDERSDWLGWLSDADGALDALLPDEAAAVALAADDREGTP